MAAWTANDAEAFGALFTDDSDYVSYDGTIARGRTLPPAQPRPALPGRPGRLGPGRRPGVGPLPHAGRRRRVRHGLRPDAVAIHAPQAAAVAADHRRGAHGGRVEDRRHPQRAASGPSPFPRPTRSRRRCPSSWRGSPTGSASGGADGARCRQRASPEACSGHRAAVRSSRSS
ncbi:hypothetical protein [Nonomuraea rubra]|uniref:hypothetical protein n=1 Tax=Nonomuraea rubra TaxID=46180 RepID=UPI003CD0664F